MKSRAGIIFISIIIILLVIVLALLVNHMICLKGDAPQFLVKIDNRIVKTVTSVTDAFSSAFAYLKYLYLKVTAISTPEYPSDYLPLYKDSRVTSYTFDEITKTLSISSSTKDDFETICQSYTGLFETSLSVDYFKQYKLENIYIAYGMIGNFTFLLEVNPSEDDKYSCSIDTQLHYLIDDELAMENFFRQQKGPNSYLFSSPYIYIYQMPGDENNLYIQLRDYKSRMLNLDTHVELYIDDVFFASRYFGDTIRVPISNLNQIKNIKMIAFDDKNCIRAINLMENFICYDAADKANLHELAENYSNAENIFIVNTKTISDISHFQNFPQLKTLYFEGNSQIRDHSPLLNLTALQRLYIENEDIDIVRNLNQLENLDVLQLSNCQTSINIDEDFSELSCIEIELIGCHNLDFSENGTLNNNLERLMISNNYSLNDIPFTSLLPNLHMLEVSECDNLTTILNTTHLSSLNWISIRNCPDFDMSQSLDNMPSLMRAEFENLPNFGKTNSDILESIWSNDSIVYFYVNNCKHINDIDYYGQPWKKVN